MCFQSKTSYNDESEESLTLKMLVCPFCWKTIPDITIVCEKIWLKCPCYNEKYQMLLKDYITRLNNACFLPSLCEEHYKRGLSYCGDCCCWLCKECEKIHSIFAVKSHVLMEYMLEIKCTIHKKKFELYCPQCDLNLCNDCKINHNDHSIITIETVDYLLIFNNTYNIFNKNKEIKQKNIYLFHQKIQAEINQTPNKLDEFHQMQKKINKLYERNQSTSEDLKSLYDYLYITAQRIGNHKLYQIWKMFTTFSNIQDEQFLNSDDSITYMFKTLKKSLTSNFIITQHDFCTLGLLDKEETEMVKQWVMNNRELTITWTLIYNPSKGTDIEEEAINSFFDRSPLLILITTTQGCRFGGYTSVGWKEHLITATTKDEEAFLFSIDKQKKYPINSMWIGFALMYKKGYFCFFNQGLYLVNNFMTSSENKTMLYFYGQGVEANEHNNNSDSFIVESLFVYQINGV